MLLLTDLGWTVCLLMALAEGVTCCRFLFILSVVQGLQSQVGGQLLGSTT